MPAALADEAEPYDIISLHAQRTMQVDNDLMVAELGVEMEGKDPANLAERVNDSMAWALNQTRKSRSVDVNTGNYHVNAVYDKNSISHWRAIQTLNLKSKDVGEMTRLIGVLQNRLLIKSMGFVISPQKRDKVENTLIGETLDAFKQRASLVSDNLAAKGYRIVKISIDTPDSVTPPRPFMMTMAMERKVSLPAVEAGMSDITVMVSGSIQLQ